MTDAIDLTPEQRNTLKDLLRRFLPGVVVWAYGSRVKWTARPNSDLDLVAFTTPAQRAQVADLKDTLAESNLPFLVDLHVWDDVPERFREIIRKGYVVVQEAKQPDSRTGTAGEWIEKTIGEAPIHIGDGNYSSKYPKSSEFVPTGVPFISASDMNCGRIRSQNFRYISKQQHEELQKGHLCTGDVIIVTRGNGIGNVAFVDQDFHDANINAQLVLLRADEKELHNRFLYYLLSSKEFNDELIRYGSGSAQPQIPIGSLVKILIRYPEIEEQRAIAHILGTLDDKIELNRRMNETLEAMARALFKSWFVDFDPVRAKAEGRDPGLPQHLADLFPDSFEDSELGEIPRGWKVKSIGDLIERLSVGQKYDQKTVSPIGKVPVLDQGKSGVIGYHDDEPGVVASADAPVVVFANHTCYMRLVPFSFSVIQNVLPFIGSGVDTVWAFYASAGKQSFSEYKGHWPDFVIHKIVVPDPKLTREFARLEHPLLKATWTRENEIHTLAALRDTLLPKLISGELRVKDGTHLTTEITQ